MRIYEQILENPANNRTIAEWAKSAGASPRTLARIFSKETGLSFGRWRQQLRLHAALAHLLELAGDTAEAAAAFQRAASLTNSIPEQRYLNRRAAASGQAQP